MKTKWAIYKELELIPDSVEEFKPAQVDLKSWLSTIWNWLVNICSRGSEPRIWIETDPMGDRWWCVYDPITQRLSCFSSEAEVRCWLEQRYYNHDGF